MITSVVNSHSDSFYDVYIKMKIVMELWIPWNKSMRPRM